jgi:hypothetical protein
MRPKDELANLTRLLEALESKRMYISENRVDVTEREIEKLKPDIEYLESVLDRSNNN